MNPISSTCGVKDVQFGENVRIVEPCNLYGCTIGSDSFIGPFVEIQKGVTLGKKTTLDIALSKVDSDI